MSEFNKKLDEQLAQLPKSIEPEKDLWVGIEHALNRVEHSQFEQSHAANDTPNNPPSLLVVSSRNQTPLWGMAAAVTFVALIGWLGFQGAGLPKQVSSADLVAQLEQQHVEQKQALLVSYQTQEPLTKDWQSQLSELDAAANAIKAALEEDPNNKALLQMLQQVYQQQLSLIETVYNPKWQAI